MPDLSGISIDRYHIIEPLGQGGMANVYKAYDTRLEREVAIKFIRRDAFSPDVLDTVLKRFDREAKSLAKLTHPNIVGIIDYGEYEGSPYLVMPYLQGGTLKQYLGIPMSIEKATSFLEPVADALAFAHQKGIVHRDVKPANILITEGGKPMLTDFGIARLLESSDGVTLTGTGMGVGTPEYMSPEQAMGREVDGRTDIYSLGIVLFELVTGQKPYTADTPMAVVLKQTTEPLPRPSSIVPGLTDTVEQILYKSLAKDAKDRFQSMTDFKDALGKFSKWEMQLPTPPAVPVVPESPQVNRPTIQEDISAIRADINAMVSPLPAIDTASSTKMDLPQKKEPPAKIPVPITKGSPPAKRKIPIWLFFVGGISLIGVIALIFAFAGGFFTRENSPLSTEIVPQDTLIPVSSLVTEIPHATLTLAPGEKFVLNVWSFTNEIQTMAIAFEKTHPDVDVVYTMIPMTNGEYQTKLMATLGTDQVPDVVALEASFVKSYVESDFLADLSSLNDDAKKADVYPFVTEVGTYDGVLKGLSYQATPGALFYRRSLAKAYFGTDDPVEMQKILGDMDKYTAAAAVVKEKSGGDTFMVASNGDFLNLFYANRAQPWIVDNTLTVDPMVNKLIETAKAFRDNGYEAKATQWQEGWFAGMNDSLVGADGKPKQIFSYFLPTWGLPYVLAPHAASADGTKTTAGDWAMITGPLPYQWGGTWLGAMKESKNLDLAKEFIRFCTLDESNLTNWATGVYTHEYLASIDPNTPGDLFQPAGDFVGSKVIVEKITAGFDNSELSKFLGGQNSYGAFALAAPSVNARLMQGSDDAIQRAFNDPLVSYLDGMISEEEMWQTWKDAVHNEFPDLIIN